MATTPIRVLIADDHQIVRQGLKALLLRGNQRIAAYSRALQLPSTYARCEPEKGEKTGGNGGKPSPHTPDVARLYWAGERRN